MPEHVIKCPYCFKTFNHDEVLFRSETAFKESDLDPQKKGRSRDDIETDFSLSDGERKKLLDEYTLREKFLIRDDEIYSNFWEKYGSTSEVSNSTDGVLDYQRPILNPRDETVVPKGAERDVDGLVYRIVDCFGEESRGRVCPHCHNPLPANYGKHQVKFLSVIGVSGSGKTVYLSKLIENIGIYTARLTITAEPASNGTREFVKKNRIEKNVSLPGGTPAKYMSQPLFYNLKYTVNGVQQNRTFVMYDIAGENCVSDNDIIKYAKFVTNADGLIVLLDPKQLRALGGNGLNFAESILATLSKVHTAAGRTKIPLALCMSKSDMLKTHDLIPEKCFEDVNVVERRKFSAGDYNEISKKLSDMYYEFEEQIPVALRNNYDNFNYFAFTTLNCGTEKGDDGREYPEDDPNPKRIEEPLYWMFKQFKYIESDMEIVDHSELAEQIKEARDKRAEVQRELDSLGWFAFGRRRELNAQIQNLDGKIAGLVKEKNS